MNNVDFLNWAKGHCRDLWPLNDDHITIDIMIVDGEHLSFKLHHDAVGCTEWHNSIEDAKASIAAKININSLVAHTSAHYHHASQAEAETANNPF